MKWISVKTRKPKKGRAVLVCQAFRYAGGKMVPGRRIAIGCRIDPVPTTAETYEFVCACAHSVLWRVSHWMPLPPFPPEEEMPGFVVFAPKKTKSNHGSARMGTDAAGARS